MKLNEELLNAIRAHDQPQVLRIIAAHADEAQPLIDSLNKADLLQVIDIAAGYVAQATANVASDISPDGKWEKLLGTTAINEGLRMMIDNPAATNFTLALLIVASALLMEDK